MSNNTQKMIDFFVFMTMLIVVGTTIVYLAMAFIDLEPNPLEWGQSTRRTAAGWLSFVFVASFFLSGLAILGNNDGNKAWQLVKRSNQS